MPVDLSNLAVGTVVPGTKWVVCGQLGEGGMGRVLEVVKEPGIRGAMKIIRPDVSHRRDFVARFLTEVRLLANLEHRNIVRVFDFDRIDDEVPFVVMELLVGGTLRQVMSAHGRPLPAPMAYEIMRQACDGLDRAHSATPSVIHRDFKPENVFLHSPAGDQPVVKVMDFGLATLAGGERDRGLFGTLRYMAPEQLRGERATVRSDVYAAALVLYEMLTGRMPWDFDVVRVQDAHLSVAPRPPSHYAPWIPRSVDRHVLAALSKNPANRPRDAFAFMARLYELQWAERPKARVHAATPSSNLAAFAVEGRSLELAPPRGAAQPAHDGYRAKSDAAISRSLHPDRRSSAPLRSLLRRHMVEAAVFAGTIAVAMPAAVLIERGRSSARAVAAPPAAMVAAPLPSPSAPSVLAPLAATPQEPPGDPFSATPKAQASTSASARPSPYSGRAKPSADANVQDPAREFMPWPAHP